ncbi:peptidase M29 aminopeptidase II [Natrinema pellirubrum DSM 15624]|uniref:Leucyl aminopeptidase (Aminopeptidase T) n=1 Tax=Natrinema pellirubrum (strain DSM 15624 / CIP 106293 / JCM 10476 / NCIMB 786 / 157) TaxID=797303 RepID=L0JPP1_NATP1|nr:aminopeptidase [Natrinema pellirubrum]AGB33204.1 leucyl aminopeptidase (aminopeptidase T) [Natrinema pellirubrum DSM 15624]ELY71869.1 peptidase M29 aminopeptidase II [Natrinema pellirubrum DSM 15624]
MDERVREHAEVLVDWSARVEAGDDVVVSVGPDAHELAVAVAEKLGERGANLLATYSSGEITRAYLQAHDDAFDETPAHELALVENADVYLSLGGGRNTSATADVPGERRRAYTEARNEIRETRLGTCWVSTAHPTRSLAQQANMAYEEYQDFAYDAILRDWESLADEMAQLKDLLDAGSEVRLVSSDTDLTMSIEGRTAVNSAASVAYDSHNLPSGEVFTAPYATEGEVTFDVPMTIRGEAVRDVRLEFADGAVVDYDAEQGGDVIGDVLETDDGARRLGELGIGMNRGIDRYTDNILFDEKMGDTVHLALGRAYDACLPDGEAGNDSSVHVDLITDVSADSRLEIDGEVVQRNGTFRFEDGFDA